MIPAVLFTTARTWKHRRRNEDMVHMYKAIFLSHQKAHNNAICSNMDRPRDFHTSWSKSDIENQIYDTAYMWSLKESTNELTYKTGVTYVENKLTVTRGWETWIDIFTPLYIKWRTKTYCIAQETLLNTLWWPIQEKNLKKELIYVYLKLIHFAVHLKIIQHGNYTPMEKKIKYENKQKPSNNEYVDSIIIPLIPRGENKIL